MSNFTEKQEEVVSLLMAHYAKEENHQNMWYLDTSYSNHMCGEKSVFSEWDESFRNTIKFGDNFIVSIMGKGNVSIRTKANSIQIISNVFFVPNLKINLLSISQLQEK
ncbi:hypothetical protein ACOSP7_022145 [Xanthoceras sorbifolium]